MNNTYEYNFELSKEFAQKMDREDSLRNFRDRFYIPKDTIYLDGNSLGLLSKDSEKAIERIINEWKKVHAGLDEEKRKKIQ